MTAILGISADYHDSAAALLVDGDVVAAAAEERFTRRKHDAGFPVHAARWCLESTGLGTSDLVVAFYEKPLSRLERVLSDQARVGPAGLPALRRSLSSFARRRLWVRARAADALAGLGPRPRRVVFAEHHVSHAAAAFLPSPFERAAVLTLDGVGEWSTGTIARGDGHRLEVLAEQRYPDSLGLFYSAVTQFCGFAVNDGESKLMGLAPYGTPRYLDRLQPGVVEVLSDGAVRLDDRYFAFRRGRRMASRALQDLLDGPPRGPDDELTQREADIAASAQALLETAVLASVAHAVELTGERRVCLGGGVALNCVANARVRASGIVDDLWVPPAPADDGGAVGAALWAHHVVDGHDRRVRPGVDRMGGAALGPAFDDADVVAWLRAEGVEFERPGDPDALAEQVAAELADGAVVGWFQGPMEFGPRALGHRSILADPRDPAVIGRLNRLVKGRESFRPFAPAVLAERAADWFELDGPRPYMIETVRLRRPAGPASADAPAPTEFAERLIRRGSELAACSHIDDTARVQTVDAAHHPGLHLLLRRFERRTGCPALVNTSFNRRDEPIVRSPADALRCFRAAGLDLLVLESSLIRARPSDLQHGDAA